MYAGAVMSGSDSGSAGTNLRQIMETSGAGRKKSLPETVIKLTGEIYQKGEKDKNSPQMLKAYMWRMRYRDMLTPDSLYTNLNGLELWAKQTDQPMDRAVLHSLIAEIYSMYAFNNQWQLRQRAEIVGEAPSADMRSGQQTCL